MKPRKFKNLQQLKTALDAGKFNPGENPIMLDNDWAGLHGDEFEFSSDPDSLLREALDLLGFHYEGV